MEINGENITVGTMHVNPESVRTINRSPSVQFTTTSTTFNEELIRKLFGVVRPNSAQKQSQQTEEDFDEDNEELDKFLETFSTK